MSRKVLTEAVLELVERAAVPLSKCNCLQKKLDLLSLGFQNKYNSESCLLHIIRNRIISYFYDLADALVIHAHALVIAKDSRVQLSSETPDI